MAYRILEIELRKKRERFWNRPTGRRNRMAKQNAQETVISAQRDRAEKDQVIFEQLKQSRTLQDRLKRIQNFDQRQETALAHDLDQYQSIRLGTRDIFERKANPRLERER